MKLCLLIVDRIIKAVSFYTNTSVFAHRVAVTSAGQTLRHPPLHSFILPPPPPLTQSAALSSDNFYGTPKPPAEPSPAAPPLNVSEALLPGARPSAQGKRKRNQSVSNMEQRTSLEPPEEEEEESPVVNGNGVAITPGTQGRRPLEAAGITGADEARRFHSGPTARLRDSSLC